MNSFSKIIAFCAAWVSFVIAAPKIWDGTADVSWYESSAQAYNLTTAEQLAGLAKLVNEGTSNFSGKTITLGADIFLNDTAGAGAGTWASVPHAEWTPIGTKSRPFKGEFDGIAGKKNRKIYGLYISDATKDYAGLLGYTSNVKISNLDVLVGRIIAKDNVGALVGYAVGGSVTNVHSEIRVTGNNHVGGLVGYFTGSLSTSSVKENVAGQDSVGGLIGFTTGSISGTDKSNSYFVGDIKGRKYVGGLVGYGSAISKSYAEGSVKGDSNYIGGVAGFANGTINSIYHVNGDVNGYGYVGGLVGYVSDSVTNSYAEGNVTGKGDCVGGLIGLSFYRYSGSTSVTTTTLNNSYFIGNVTGVNRIGGLIGQDSVYRSVDNKYSVGRYIKKSHSQGNVNGKSYVGGVVGLSNYGAYSSTYNTNFYGYITSSYHEGGDVIGSSGHVGGVAGSVYSSINFSYHVGGFVKGYNGVGGLVGHTDGSVTNSYAEGNVTGTGPVVGGLAGGAASVESSYHIGGDVFGSDYVGGLIGNVSSNVTNSYSEGNVTGTGDYVGGLVGIGTSAVVKSSNHTKGDVKGRGFIGGLVGLAKSVTNSYSEGNVTGTGNRVGGLVGSGTSVDSSNHTKGNVQGFGYVGGLIGYASLSVKNSYSEGDVVGTGNYVGGLIGMSEYYYSGSSDVTIITTSNTYAIGNVKGKGYVGGLVGLDSIYRQPSNTTMLVKIVRASYSLGNVVGSDKYVGGLLGKSNYGYKSSSYNSNISLQIFSSYHKNGYVSSDSSYVGGVIGYAGGTIDSAYHSGGNVSGSLYVGGLVGKTTSIVENSHSEGNVIGNGHYVGGLIGETASSVKNSYSEGNVTGIGYVGGLVGNGISVDLSSHTGGTVTGKGSYVGGLIGYAYYMVKNSYSEGDVIGTDNVGGLVGKGGRIHKSYHTEGSVSGYNYVGGVAGYVSCTLTGCVALVDSSYHADGSVNGYGYVGGLVGLVAGSITNSYSKGEVLGTKDYVGGVAGSVSGKIRNSNADAKYVKGLNFVGGLAGYASDSIDVSYFEGDSVTGIYQIGGLVGYAKSAVDSSYSTANVKGDDNVGGLIGSAYGNVSNSYAMGNVIGDEDHSSAGNDNLGGLVGYQYSGSVSKSMALGDVSGTTKLGGLVGRFDGTKISQSYANGNITGSYYGDPADEVGNYYIGGLVGYAKGTLEEIYASGVVKGIENEPVYTGCIVGYVNGSLSVAKSYYDKTKCGLGIDGGEETASVSGLPSKTTAEMQTQSTYVNWNFIDTWKIQKDSYPFLQIYSNSLTNAVVATASLEGIKYDGKEKFPIVTSVTLFGETLEYETEYTVTYKDNINAGTASINVCGIKPYGGCKVVEFEIAGVAVKPTIAAIDNMTYTGRALTPEIKVYNGEALLDVSDYAVEYKNNVNAGTATVSVAMKGNYSGSASKTFTIEKATPVISQNPKASDVVLGLTLAASELSGGRADVDGEFVWKTSTTKPALENEGYAVVFVPTDTKNYTNSAEIVVPVKVLDLVYVAIHLGNTTLDSVALEKGSNYTLPKAPDSTGYDFAGFYNGSMVIGKSGDKISVTGNTVVDAKYNIKTFVITFMNGKTKLQSNEVAYGTVPTAPKVTLPENSAQFTYSFTGWDKEIVAAVEPATYNAIIDSVVNKYNVVFENYDETVLKDSSYAYGTAVAKIVKPVTPTREASAQYTYTFKAWDPAVVEVTKDAVYTAIFDSTVNTYIVKFVNEFNVSQNAQFELKYGAIPEYEGVPTRTSTSLYSYTFKNWTPEVVAVSGDATYKALFDSTAISSSSSFADESSSSIMQLSSSSSSSKEIATSSSSSRNDESCSSMTVSSSSTAKSSSSVVKSSSSSIPKSSSSSVKSSSSNAKSSSSVVKSSSSSAPKSSSSSVKSSSSSKAKSSSSKKTDAIVVTKTPQFSIQVIAHNIQISKARVGSAYALFDMQGKVLQQGQVYTTNFNMSVARPGNYLLKIDNRIQRVVIK
ncbi:GLUG motif-containing protein [Fibrobacter sp. UWB13]|uniref:GLUG motif-containing protein n=1 Tax=Fibrobacter sp. UWB13 TaxID=1896204 RepID=UPI000A0B036B|nr:GLUG motif-containing protein [Fibrobacter sp. UWB13]SMG15282.1 The GLUG motif-containing protein [Fibrobacter sp. UWB13]